MIPDETLEALKAKHGPVHALRKGDEVVFVRLPTRPEYRMFRAHAMDEAKRADAPENLLRKCIVHPDAAAVEALFNRLPALADNFAGELMKLAGGGGSDAEKV